MPRHGQSAAFGRMSSSKTLAMLSALKSLDFPIISILRRCSITRSKSFAVRPLSSHLERSQ